MIYLQRFGRVDDCHALPRSFLPTTTPNLRNVRCCKLLSFYFNGAASNVSPINLIFSATNTVADAALHIPEGAVGG